MSEPYVLSCDLQVLGRPSNSVSQQGFAPHGRQFQVIADCLARRLAVPQYCVLHGMEPPIARLSFYLKLPTWQIHALRLCIVPLLLFGNVGSADERGLLRVFRLDERFQRFTTVRLRFECKA
jgi:hypothetical protein